VDTEDPGGIRLIGLDMDGTLLGEDGRVSPRNLAALRAAQSAGVEVVIATGRRHSYAMRVLRALHLDPAGALVSSNGAVTRTVGSATHPTELIARAHLSHATLLWLLGHLGVRGHDDPGFRNALVLTFDLVAPDGEDARGALVVEHMEELHSSIGKWMAANEPYIARIEPIEDAITPRPDNPHPQPAIQAMLCGTIDRMRRAEARLLEHPGISASGMTHEHSAAIEVTLHRTEYPDRDLSILDILPAGCSKGAALLALGATRGIAAGQMLTIGDNWNDVSMLEIAGRAVLMDNAPEDLKVLARERGWQIGLANHADGVAEAIEAALAVPC
jgi:hydroxymethylpyrimidine pyrophosphatase-like HAD family hydrolase